MGGAAEWSPAGSAGGCCNLLLQPAAARFGFRGGAGYDRLATENSAM
jgi:hypothetical protein